MLREIPSTSALFLQALIKRAQLRDQEVVPDIIRLLSTFIYSLFDVIHYVWCDELKKVVNWHLQALKKTTPKDFTGGWSDAHYVLSKLLMMIPPEDVECLLNQHWEYIGYSPLFIQTALYVGTQSCLELADSSIKKCPPNIDVFRHINNQFGIMIFGRQ